MKKAMNRLSIIFLAVVMAVCFIPAMSRTAQAAGDKTITTVDIGNIWTWLVPTNAPGFTVEVHDELDEDKVNFTDKMELVTEKWQSDDSSVPVLSKESGNIPMLGKTYYYTISLKAKDGYVFKTGVGSGLPFKLIVNGLKADSKAAKASVSADGKTVDITFSAYPVEPVTIERINISNPGEKLKGAFSAAKVTGISDKKYTGKAQKPKPTVKMTVNWWDEITLKEGTDYTVSYKNNKNVGKATVTIKGIGNYTGTITKTFRITKSEKPNKANNPLSVKAKTVTVKYSKVKKKAQTLSVSKVLKVSKAKGTVTYKKAGGNAKITINKKTGKVTVKKGLKKGTYKVKIKVTAAGNTSYKSASKTVTFTVKVK